MQQTPDPFGIRSGSRFVIERAHDVHIDDRQVVGVARQIAGQPASGDHTSWHADHLGDIELTNDELANFVLVLDALNFYFWGDPRWRVTWGDRTENGYWALTLALRRAIHEGYPITNAEYLSQISALDVARILRGESVIPMFPARVQNLREIGSGLLREQEGRFLGCIEACDKSGVELMRRVVTLFPSFVDVRSYEARTIPFYKRAQILVSDLAGAFASRDVELFNDLAFLTAFADYKVPQVLHQLGVLRYSKPLEHSLQRMDLIPAGDRREIEIRAATIVAVELIAGSTAILMPDYAVDWHLWELGQHESEDRLPYHRTPTVAY